MNKLSMCRFVISFVTVLCVAAIAEAGAPPCASSEGADHAANTPVAVPVAGKVCQFCHVPHQDTTEGGMLWNSTTEQTKSGKAYALNIPANVAVPEDFDPRHGKGRLCMSCHDGTVARPSIKENKDLRASSCVNWKLVAP